MFNEKLKNQIKQQQINLEAYRAVLDAINRSMAAIEFTPNGEILSANDNFLRTMGYSRHDLPKHHSSFCDEHYRQSQEYRELWERLQRGEFVSGLFKRIQKDGQAVYLEASYNPIKNALGQVEKVIKFAHEVTEAVLENKEHERQVAAIDRSMAVIEFLPDGTILSANANFLRAVGFSLPEIAGKHHRIFCSEDYANSKDYQGFWNRLNQGEFISGLFERRDKNGKILWLEASYNPIFDDDGHVYKVIKFANDVTEREEDVRRDVELVHSTHLLSTEQREICEQGHIIIGQTVNGMRSIAASASMSAQHISELEKQSSQINTLVKTIKEIADQTNLLALNASIEAARAGEMGRGFAVVADEVRKLAERTNTSTVEITNMIESIAQLTSTAITSINKMVDQAETGVTQANQAGEAIQKIQASNNEISNVVGQFSAVKSFSNR